MPTPITHLCFALLCFTLDPLVGDTPAKTPSGPRYFGARSPAGQISQIEPCPSDIGKNAAYYY